MPSNEKKKLIIDNKVDVLNKPLSEIKLSNSINENIKILKKIFENDDIFILREIDNKNNHDVHFAIGYFDGLVNVTIINDNIIKPLILANNITKDNIIDVISKQVIYNNEFTKIKNLKEIVTKATYGDVILLIDGVDEVLILNTKLLEKRPITEPEGEKILVGPREGFTEALLTNLSLVRRKLRTNKLKFKYMTFGDLTNTKACVCYIDSVADQKILDEVYKRLKQIKIDGVLDTNYLAELTRNNRLSLFRTTGYTERPDVIVGKLLEGRIAIFLDGTPVVITVPYLFIENFQNSEDYYFSPYYTSFSRFLRILGFILTITIPAFYISIVVFQKEMLPTQLFINIAIERQSVPLPAAVEAFFMLMVFDILRETGVRMPTNIGEALGTVGVIVIGQAAVQAKLVAAPMIIVVAFTGITSLLVPKLNAPVIYLRLFLLFIASFFGFFGFMIGLSLIFLHICNLKSFTVPQISLSGTFKWQNIKDIFIRAPLWKMKKRPPAITNNQTRLKQTGVR